MSKKRRNHSPDFKAKVALAAIKGDETLSELARRYQVNANLIVKWKKLLLENSGEVFASGKGLAPDRESEIKSLQAKIGSGNWIKYYNHSRKHQTLGTTPELMYAGSSSLRKAA